MKSDEEIERERAALELLIGPTRAGWYAEACKKEYDDPPEELLWACRYREMAMEAGRLEDELARLRLLLTRKNCALDVFASGLQWDQPRAGEYVWQGDNEYRNPMTFAAKERDADEPTD